MLPIRIRVELGTLPKQPVWLKLIYCLCGVQMSVSNQQVALLQAPPHFWLLHLPQEGPKVMRITRIRSEAELRGQRRLSQWKWHRAVSTHSRVPTDGPRKHRPCWAAGLVGDGAHDLWDKILDNPSWSSPINSLFIFFPQRQWNLYYSWPLSNVGVRGTDPLCDWKFEYNFIVCPSYLCFRIGGQIQPALITEVL